MLSIRPASRSRAAPRAFCWIVSAKDIFNGFDLFLTWNNGRTFQCRWARTQSIHSNLSIRELCTHGSRQTGKPALIADMMLVVGQAVLTVTDELMITEIRFSKGDCLLNREKILPSSLRRLACQRYFLDDFERPKLTVASVRKDRIEMAKLSFNF